LLHLASICSLFLLLLLLLLLLVLLALRLLLLPQDAPGFQGLRVVQD